MDDGPELYIFRPEGGDEWRAELERQRAESRQRHLSRTIDALAFADACSAELSVRAEALLDAIFVSRDVENGGECRCSCHPRLPDSDLHDYGAACSCRRTAEERRRSWAEWSAENERYWKSEEGRAITARRDAERAAVREWAAADPGVIVDSFGGQFPEQWEGIVDGHSFYFRERHDHWRIELDLQPTGRFVEVWTGGDLDDESNRRTKETTQGEVIASGDTYVDNYGSTPLERGRFIVDTVRTHLHRAACTVHRAERAAVEVRIGRRMAWCPACGTRTSEG